MGSSKASKVFIRTKKSTFHVNRHTGRLKERILLKLTHMAVWVTFMGCFSQVSFGLSFLLAWFTIHIWYISGSFPGGKNGKEPTCQCRGHKRHGGLIPGSEDPLEESMATHSSILAWRIPWTEEPDGLQCTRSWRVGYTWCTCTSFQDGFYWEGLWVEHPLTSLPFWTPRSLSMHVWLGRSPDFCVCAKSLQLCLTLGHLWTVAL